MKNIYFYSTFRICFYFVQLSLVLPTENVVSFIKLRLHWKGCITVRNYAETFCTNIRNNLLQNCSAKYLPSRKLKFEGQPLKCYNSKTRLSHIGFPIYFLIFTITSPIAYMVVLISESVLFRFCSDRNLFRDLSDKVVSRVLFSVLSDSVLFMVLSDKVFFIVLSDMVLSRVLSDRNVCRILRDRVLLRVLSDRVLFRFLKNRALFRVFKDKVFFRVLSPRFPT